MKIKKLTPTSTFEEVCEFLESKGWNIYIGKVAAGYFIHNHDQVVCVFKNAGFPATKNISEIKTRKGVSIDFALLKEIFPDEVNTRGDILEKQLNFMLDMQIHCNAVNSCNWQDEVCELSYICNINNKEKLKEELYKIAEAQLKDE